MLMAIFSLLYFWWFGKKDYIKADSVLSAFGAFPVGYKRGGAYL